MRPHQATRTYLAARIPKSLGYTFTFGALAALATTRPRGALRRLALHDRYAAMGAYFHDLSGWEMPYWFSPEAPPPKVEYTYDRQPWHDLAAR